MVGRAVIEHCRGIGDQVFGYDHAALDISDAERVKTAVHQDKPEAVINCAAWTDVDGCESNRDRAFAANASGPEHLAIASREVGATLVTISTDYVFDGKKNGFYTQLDKPAPESVYGLSKLEGETLSQAAHARTIVVRTGFIFGPGGKNFLSTIIERARRGEKLNAIRDAYGTPTYAPDLAGRLRELAQTDFAELTKSELPALFHVVNAGEGVSYEEFARAALEISGYAAVNLESVAMNSLHRPAPRPQNSRLKCLVSPAIGLAPLPLWKDALEAFAMVETGRELAAKS
jgi:dTDP-4-dehydrorhamnose reductase